MARLVVTGPIVRPLAAGMSFPIGGYPIVSTTKDVDSAVIEVADAKAAATTLLNQVGINGVNLVQDNYLPLGVVYPMSTLANTLGKQFPVVGITPQWQERVKYGEGLVIGVADTGTPPPAAQAFMALQYEEVMAGEDKHGHATAVASIIAGRLGVLPRAKIIFAQALPGGRGDSATVHNALVALADAGCDIINASLGGSPDRHIQAAVHYCQSKGVPVSAAIGNGGPNDRPGSPADVSQFAWGATTFDGKAPASFSSGGCNWAHEDGAGPGVGVGVAHLDGGYGVGDGTSFSAPLLTAMMAAIQKYGRGQTT